MVCSAKWLKVHHSKLLAQKSPLQNCKWGTTCRGIFGFEKYSGDCSRTLPTEVFKVRHHGVSWTILNSFLEFKWAREIHLSTRALEDENRRGSSGDRRLRTSRKSPVALRLSRDRLDKFQVDSPVKLARPSCNSSASCQTWIKVSDRIQRSRSSKTRTDRKTKLYE